MLCLMSLCLFASSSAFPFGRSEVENYKVQLVSYKELPYQRHAICLPSPFLKQICLPSALQFFMPLRTLETGQQRCLSIPIMRAYVVKVCPPTESVSKEENLNRSLKERIKEVVTEAEKERLPDNTNTEVNGGEVEPEYFVKKESNAETKESKVEDKNSEAGNKITRVSEEEFGENESLEEPPTDENFGDENINKVITCEEQPYIQVK